MADIIQIIKKAAVEAVEAAKPHRFLYGQVVGINPLNINIEQRLTIDENHIILTSGVQDRQVEVELTQGVKKTMKIYGALKVGDKVQMLRVHDGQQYVVLDKVVIP